MDNAAAVVAVEVDDPDIFTFMGVALDVGDFGGEDAGVSGEVSVDAVA